MFNKLAFAILFGSAAFDASSQAITDIQAKQESSAYAQDVRGTKQRSQNRKSRHTDNRTQGDAVIGCDGQLEPPVAKATAPAIATPVAAAPAAALPPKRRDFAVTQTKDQAFTFNKAALSNAAKNRIDDEVMTKLGGCAKVDLMVVTGHTDRIGSKQYNQKLSQKRAAAVASYLKAKGVAANINVVGAGATQPVKSCSAKLSRKNLIACLSPNRRVVIEAQGQAK